MSGTTRSPAKKAAVKREASVTPIEAVPQSAEEVSPEVQAILDDEQNRLNSATMQAQLNYLSARVAELTQENYKLRQELGEQ